MKWKSFFRSTVVKYILSYAAILVTVITGIYLIINYNLKNKYLNLYIQDSQNLINDAADRITKGFMQIEKTNLILASDVNIIAARYSSNPDYARYQIVTELGKYCTRNSFSKDIIYYSRNAATAYSTTRQCIVTDSYINITMYGKNDTLIPKSYYESDDTYNLVVSVTGADGSILLYSPEVSSTAYRVIYILDQNEIAAILDSCLSKGIKGVSLTDLSKTTILASGDTSQLAISTINNESTTNNFSLSIGFPSLVLNAVFDTDYLNATTNAVFVNAYLLLAILTFIGLIIMFFAMKITYTPLYKLKKNITNCGQYFTNDINLLNSSYQASAELNMFLQKSLNNYKTIIHQSIQNSSIFSSDISSVTFANIDQLFVSDNKLIISVVKVILSASPTETQINQILQQFKAAYTSIVLDINDNTVSILVAWKDGEQKDDHLFLNSIKDLITQMPCMIAYSNYSTNPLDIARLYSNATTAEACLSYDHKLVGYDDISDFAESSLKKNYSYTLFDNLNSALDRMDSEKCYQLIGQVFDSISFERDSEVYIRCILIDMTTMIGTYLSKNSIKYEKYKDVFSQTLDLCRNSNYRQTAETIQTNFKSMLDILYDGSRSNAITAAQIELFVKANYDKADFSITMLSEHFEVSIAYMSYLFKKLFCINFSNYVWDLRLKKAQLLLSTTDLPIEKVSLLVGYDNPASFRRKFKDETGISPSRFRKDLQEL